MNKVYLFRFKRSDEGTEGVLVIPGFICKTLELPWRENQRNISCIPPGEYPTTMIKSAKYGRVYWVTAVPDRTYILIHSGNFAGDVDKGFKTHVQGCILTGTKFGTLAGQRAILNSRIALRRFKNNMKNEPFIFNIIEWF